MNTIQRLIKNIGVQVISQMLSYILGFFILMYSARYLGVEGFGILSLATAFTGIFSVCMDMGLSTLTVREVSKNKSILIDYIANITLIKIVLAFATFFLMFLIVKFLGYSQQTMQVIYLIAFSTIFNAFTQLFYAAFQANEKMEYQSLGVILSSVLLLVGVLLAIYYNFDIVLFSSIYTLVGVLVMVYAISVFSWRFTLPAIKFDKTQWIALLKESWPFAITGISITLYLWIDTVMLSVIQGQEVVGLYNAAYKLILVLLFVPLVFNNAIFPLMSQYYISSKETLKITFEKLFKIMLLLAIPIGVGTVIIANEIIVFIYGERFIGSVIALQILIWSTVLIFARSPFERLLEASNKQLSVTKIFIIGVLFNVTLNMIIIPKFSYIGAGITTVLTDILVFGLLTVAVRKSNRISISRNIKITFIKIVLASFIMGLIINQLIYLHIFVLIIIGTITYSLTLLIMKILDDDEILMIKSIFYRGD